MDNEALLQLIKNIIKRTIDDSTEITKNPTSGNVLSLLKLYQESLNAIWEELQFWQTKNQKHQSLEQVFGLINNEYPLGLWNFYQNMIKEGWTQKEALMFTKDLLALLLGPKS